MRKLRDKIDGSRGKSLMERHKDKDGKEKEDDPSKRVFDYEKDMALGTKVSHKQKREMLTKAKALAIASRAEVIYESVLWRSCHLMTIAAPCAHQRGFVSRKRAMAGYALHFWSLS